MKNLNQLLIYLEKFRVYFKIKINKIIINLSPYMIYFQKLQLVVMMNNN